VNHDISIGKTRPAERESARLLCSVGARMYFLPQARKHAKPGSAEAILAPGRLGRP
jgi:hypothetical protein